MAKFIYEFEGVRGRNLKLYDTKIIITTKKTVGSFFTGNFTDGKKTIYLCDVVGVQHKKSGLLIGYLQFETPSMQMNNKSDNMFSENTFTYENGKNGITNELIENLYQFITDRIEEIKYNTTIIDSTPNFKAIKPQTEANQNADTSSKNASGKNENKNKYMWDHWSEEDTSIGECDVCGTKNQFLVYAEYQESDSIQQKNLCYECFSHRQCKPVTRK